MKIRWENMAPDTEVARDFCAEIGPLQLGVVLVIFINQNTEIKHGISTWRKSM